MSFIVHIFNIILYSVNPIQTLIQVLFFQVCIQVGDIPTSKHSLKKAHKLGSPTPEETERIVKYFKAGNINL